MISERTQQPIWKIEHELKKLAILSLYLYACLGAIFLYTDSVLREHGVTYEYWGFAAIKALLLAKFMLIGDTLHLDKSLKHKAMVYSVLLKSLVYLGFLILLSGIEELVVGLIHGRSAVHSVEEIANGSVLQFVASCFLLWLILIPVISIRQLDALLGEGVLYRAFFATEGPSAKVR